MNGSTEKVMSKKKLPVILGAAAAVVVVAAVVVTLLLTRVRMPGHGNIDDIKWYDVNGTEFVIEDVDMLYDVVTLSYHYDFAGQTLKLGQDITVNHGNASNWEKKAPAIFWAPIRNFAGTFDGQGHTISGLFAKSDSEPTALFSYVQSGAVIQNLRLENSAFLTAGEYGSASIATHCAGTYQRIYSSAIVRCSYGAAGGLFSKQAGKMTVEECWFDGEVETSHRNIGGIADAADGNEMILNHCLNTGKIIDTWLSGANNAGGLVGVANNGARLIISDSFSGGAMELGSAVRSGIVLGGGDSTSNTTLLNTFCVKGILASPVSNLISHLSGGAVPIVEKDLLGTGAYRWTDLDFGQYWACREGELPMLACFAQGEALDLTGVVREVDYDWYDDSADELYINDLSQLYAFTLLSYNTDYSNKKVKLAVDLTLNEGNAADWIEKPPESCWYPVQNFAGTFDGQGHTVSGLYVIGDNAQGMFSRVQGSGSVRNLRLVNSLIHATADATTNTNYAMSGAIVGRGGGTFDSIYTDAIVYGEGMQVGGIIGQINISGMITTITNCWFNGKVMTVGEEYGYQAGGIVGGHVLGTVNMSHCLFSGTIHTEVNKGSMAGGFVGMLVNKDPIMNIGDCLNVGTMDTANPWLVGGAVGSSYVGPEINIKNTFAKLECMKNADGDYVSHNGGEKVAYSGAAFPVYAKYLTGMNAYRWTTLNFDKYWSVRADGYPVPTVFYEGEPVSTKGVARVVSFDWYDEEAKAGTIRNSADFVGFTMLSWATDFEGATVRLGADVALNSGDAAAWGNAAPYYQVYPIRSFAGTFNGQGHTISGVYQKGEWRLGLFYKTEKEAVVRNFRLVNSYFDITGHGEDAYAFSGSITANGGGTLRDIYSSAILRTRGYGVGGMVGRLNLADNVNHLSSLWFDGVIDAVDEEYGYVDGGIVGQCLLGKSCLEHCLFTGTIKTAVTNKGSKVGGIVGWVWNKSSVEIYDCLSAGTLQCGNQFYKGAILGTLYTNNTVTIRNCYADSVTALDVSGKFVSAAVHSAVKDGELTGAAIPVTTDKLKGVEGYRWTTLDFDNYWVARDGQCPAPKSLVAKPVSTASAKRMVNTDWYKESRSVLTVKTAEELYGMQALSWTTDFAGKTIRLGADITLNSGNASNWGTTPPTDRWESIPSFAGVLDGQGHTVSGVYIDGGSGDFVGFISTLDGGTVKNLRLVNSYVTGTGTVIAAVAANSRGGLIESVYTDAVVSSPSKSNLAGFISTARGDSTTVLRNCQFDGSVHCTTTEAGGNVGGFSSAVVNSGTVLQLENCLMSGTVETDGAASAVGGITALAYQEGATLNLSNVLISGKVSSNGGAAGAITKGTGYLVLHVSNTYITADSCAGGANGIGNGTAAASGTAQVLARSTLTGAKGYQNTMLDFTVKPYWVPAADSTPALKTFYTGSVADVSGVLRPDTSWYSKDKDSFEISTVAQLMGLAALSKSNNFAGKTVALSEDMDMTGVDFSMIGDLGSAFSGTFDGGGHKISGLSVTSTENCVGLFRVTGDAVIRDLVITDCSFESTNAAAGNYTGRVGAVVGQIIGNTAVSDVLVTDSVTVTGHAGCGGIAGFQSEGSSSFTNCLVLAKVWATAAGRSAGILGTMSSNSSLGADFSFCAFEGILQSNASYAFSSASIIGWLNVSGSTIRVTDCAGKTELAGYWSGAAVGNANTDNTVTIKRFCNQTNKGNLYGNGTVATATAVASDSYAGQTIEIASAEKLMAIAYLSKKATFEHATLKLTDDIDLSHITFPGISDGLTVPFKGVFDGQNHTVNHLSVSGSDYTGFFRAIFGGGAQVKNFTLTSSTISGTNHVGAVAGFIRDAAKISDVTVADDCSVTGSANFVGGIAGRIAHDAQIENCTVDAPVSGTYGVGGLAGCADLAATAEGIRITDSTVTGAVTGSSDRIGGVVGQLRNFADPTVSITNCTVTGAVTGRDVVGGMVGGSTGTWVSLTITGGAVSGAVTGREIVGGIVAKASSATTVDSTAIDAAVTGTKGDLGGVMATASAATTVKNVDCAAEVSADGATIVGGIIGAIRGVTATVENTRFSGSVNSSGTEGTTIAGGIVACIVNNNSKLVATDVLVSGDVTVAGAGYVGGIAGGSFATGSVTITRALVTGALEAAEGSNLGALLGRTYIVAGNHLIGTITDSYATDDACAGSLAIGGNGLMDRPEAESGVTHTNVKQLSADQLTGNQAEANAAGLFSGTGDAADRWSAVEDDLPQLSAFLVEDSATGE